MNKKLLGVPLLFLYVFISAQNKRLTLQQCVETGINNNLEVLQSDLQSQTAEINWKQARLNILPNINGYAGHNFNQGRSIDPFTNGYINQNNNNGSYQLSSSVILFNGLSLQNEIKQTSLTYQASKMDWQQAKDNLTINIILAYLQVLNNEDQLVQSQDQLDLTKKQVDRLEVLNQSGAISPSDLSDLRGEYANDQLNIISIQNALESSKISLCQLMNIPYDKNMELEKISTESFATKYEDTPDKIYETALQQFAQVKAADFRKESAEKGVKIAKGQLFPTLSFGANTNTTYSSTASQSLFINTTDFTSTDYVTVGAVQYPVVKKVSNFNSEKIDYSKQLKNNRYTTFGFNLNIPIFRSLQLRNRVKQARIILKNNDWAAKTTKTQLQQSIEQAYINMTSASDRYKVLLQQTDAYTESFSAADTRFNSGVGTPIDYLIAKNKLDRANINLITAKYDFVLRTKILDYYKGKQLW